VHLQQVVQLLVLPQLLKELSTGTAKMRQELKEVTHRVTRLQHVDCQPEQLLLLFQHGPQPRLQTMSLVLFCLFK
jgi:hypothetical protein